MSARRLFGGAVVAAALALTGTVTAKEQMTATLRGHFPVAAKPGSTVRVVWTVGSRAANAASDDDRFYVQLYNERRQEHIRAFGHLEGRRYVARVRVPRGGIDDVGIFLVGRSYYADGTSRRYDMELPITNDPLAR